MGGFRVIKVLYVDIETAPNTADVWGLWNQNVGLSQLRSSARIIGVGAKWRGAKGVKWFSEFDHGQEQMLERVHKLYDQADVVVTYNGDSFDHKHLNAAWVKAGITPPSPFVSLDLYKVVKQNFRFPSKKLAYVAQELLGDTKVKHSGHQMWRDCLDDGVDPDVKRRAWRDMARYCKQDVALMEPLHEVLTPWLPARVNAALMAGPSDVVCCQKCGGEHLRARGTAYTASRAYPQYQCVDCGGWTRDRKASWSVA